MLAQGLRSLAPAGLVDIVRAKRFFERIQVDVRNPLRAALSLRLLRMLALSRLRYVPPQILRDAECMVDVGANVGTWSEAALELVAPKRLYAIEPVSEAFSQLQTRVGNRPGVTLINCAVGAERGTAPFHIMSASEFNSLLPLKEDVRQHFADIEARDEIVVEVMPLDDLLHDVAEISVLKIDVQGSESAVLDGAGETLKRTGALILEVNFVSNYEGDTLFTGIHQRMTSEFGFELYSLIPAYYNEDGKLIWADAVYTKKESRQMVPDSGNKVSSL